MHIPSGDSLAANFTNDCLLRLRKPARALHVSARSVLLLALLPIVRHSNYGDAHWAAAIVDHDSQAWKISHFHVKNTQYRVK